MGDPIKDEIAVIERQYRGAINELAMALAKAQGMMKGAAKDSTNPHFKSKYADLASVWDACRDALTANGLSIAQLPIASERDEIVLETLLLHSSGQYLSSVINIPVSKADAQGYGSALTYARRYGLAAMVGVAPEDDDGNAAANAKPNPMKAKSAHLPSSDSWDDMSINQRNRLSDISIAVKELLEMGDVENAVGEIEQAGLSSEEKVALWIKFDSKQRAAMKAHKSI